MMWKKLTGQKSKKTMQKYPFAPTTPFQDVVDYLKTSFVPAETVEKPFVHYENYWYKTHQFQEGLITYTVYMDVISNEYGCHEGEWNRYAPNKGIYDDWDDMIVGVAKKLADEWKIPY